ncbi:MAG TPA: hypothetical protein H9663_03590 [Firmicutes bacterium]|nr:hypothetical protein [Bacillota bacterium]
MSNKMFENVATASKKSKDNRPFHASRSTKKSAALLQRILRAAIRRAARFHSLKNFAAIGARIT